ncbi:MAG: hypothetical protein HZB56_14800 [Deltaproteobacteria bacterium]|nr:hypothetical protein [Deltaproteobacteria bacterium]
MKKGILFLVAGLSVTASNAADAPPALPKEGTYVYTNVLSATVKVLPLGKDRLQFAYDTVGASVSPSGEGLMNNSSVRCVGGMHIVNGAWEDESGSCVITRPDGDQIFNTYRASGKVGGEVKGVTTITGGTGKLAGITGQSEFVRQSLRPAAEGTSQSVTRGKGSYRLP